MMNINPNVSSIMAKTGFTASGPSKASQAGQTKEFNNTLKALKKYVTDAEQFQQGANTSVQNLLSGKNGDLASVVSAVSKADMSFKLLVGVRNKLIEAYKQTMNMQV
ncbi:MAG: flagellar hook-basal body complex protein FliE [Planctomycetota bacterium]|jgi:flagellar hook-basal body complex protein FliE